MGLGEDDEDAFVLTFIGFATSIYIDTFNRDILSYGSYGPPAVAQKGFLKTLAQTSDYI